nr:PREDICTED: aminopeptidase N-like isoform X1 [Bemisia tabaci]
MILRSNTAPLCMINLCLLWISYFLLVGSRSARAMTPRYRLPGDVIPEHYNISILTNLDDNDFTYHGRVTIKLKCIRATNKIVLHAYTLTIGTDVLRVSEARSEGAPKPQHIKITNSSYDTVNEFFIAETNKPLQPNRTYIYDIPYKGTLNTNLWGFYRSSYLEQKSNETRWLAVTQFSPIHARKAFPCFDEPAMKATFSISLIHDKKYTALSNMPVKHTSVLEDRDHWVKTEFETTVKMSTYVVGFMISDFEHLPPTETATRQIPFKVWVRRDALEQTRFSLFVGPQLLDFLERYFGIDYPLPKQDLAAIPDFNFNAMENWGLITFREKAILYDPKSTSVNLQQSLTFTTAHEIAHMWFGNLVTMQWWTDLWLKEGFASYLGAIAMENVITHWQTMSHQVATDLGYTFALDSLNSSHPVSVPIGNPAEIAQLFDKIPYAKGPLIIRMMNHFLGDETFQAGLQQYLNKFAYGNAEKDDLWNELTSVAHVRGALPAETSVKIIMDSWTVQTGYPLVNVQRDYEQGTAKVSQSRYFQNTELRDESGNKQCWWIPLSYTTGHESDFNSTKPKAWLNCSGPIIITDLPNEDSWVLFNLKATGTYRVNYDLKNWEMLSEVLNDESEFRKIDPLNRMLLVVDSFSLAWTRDLNYDLAFKLASYLKYEPEFIVWDAADAHLSEIAAMLRYTPDYDIYKEYIQSIVRPAYEKIGPLAEEPDDSETSQRKSVITAMARRCGLDLYELEAKELFKQAMTSSSDSPVIPKDIRGSVYCTGVALSGEREWKLMWNRYVKSNIPAEKENILMALGCSKDEAVLGAYLSWSIDENSLIRRQDSLTVFRSVAANQIGYPIARTFFVRRLDDIYNFFGVKTAKMGSYLTVLANYMNTQKELDEIKNVISRNESIFEYSKLAQDQFFETVQNNILWFKTNQNNVISALRPK